MKKINARVVTDQETLPNQGIAKKMPPPRFLFDLCTSGCSDGTPEFVAC